MSKSLLILPNKMVYLLLVLIISYSDSFCQSENFSTCHSQQDYGGVWPQYYQTGAGYEGGLHELKSFFYKSFESGYQNETGYLTVRFIINCNGETGNFEVLEATRDYEPYSFSPKTKTKLLNLVKGLKNWNPGFSGNGNQIDSQKFLTFILENGTLIDILPK